MESPGSGNSAASTAGLWTCGFACLPDGTAWKRDGANGRRRLKRGNVTRTSREAKIEAAGTRPCRLGAGPGARTDLQRVYPAARRRPPRPSWHCLVCYARHMPTTEERRLPGDVQAGFAPPGSLVDARRAEGARLAVVLARLIDDIGGCATTPPRRPLPAGHAARPHDGQSADAARDAPTLPEERFAQEVALLAARSDVREELDRLASHTQARKGSWPRGRISAEGSIFWCRNSTARRTHSAASPLRSR